jgi:drug/metabolite transporter (DMT)-like permease
VTTLVWWGAQRVTSGMTAVLQATSPVFGALMALWMGDRVNGTTMIALAAGVGGVAVISWNQMQIPGASELAGTLAVVAGAMCVAWAYTIVRHHARHIDAAILITGQSACGLVPLAAAALIVEGNPFAQPWTRTAVASLVYLALAGSVAAFWLNYWLLRRMSATAVLSMAVVQPVFAVALGALVLGETMTAVDALGGVCILGSVAVVLRQPRA